MPCTLSHCLSGSSLRGRHPPYSDRPEVSRGQLHDFFGTFFHRNFKPQKNTPEPPFGAQNDPKWHQNELNMVSKINSECGSGLIPKISRNRTPSHLGKMDSVREGHQIPILSSTSKK